MGKNSDIESISNSLSKTILHELVIEYGNRPESIPRLKKEAVEYGGQSIKKISKINLNDRDKKVIRDKVIRKIENDLKRKYNDIKVPKEAISKKVDEELFSFFN